MDEIPKIFSILIHELKNIIKTGVLEYNIYNIKPIKKEQFKLDYAIK